MRKACEKKSEMQASATLSMLFFVFVFQFFSFSVKQKCIQKTGILTAKIVPSGSGGLGLVGWFFAKLKKRKEFYQVLDFQRFASFRNSFRKLFASFSQYMKPLIFNALLTSSKSLRDNAFTHAKRCGGGSRVGC